MIQYHEYLTLQDERNYIIEKPTALNNNERERLSQINRLCEIYEEETKDEKFVCISHEKHSCTCGFNDIIDIYTKNKIDGNFFLNGQCPECSKIIYQSISQAQSIEEIYWREREKKLKNVGMFF